MKARNRFFSILLALAMVITYMPGLAFALDDPAPIDPAGEPSVEEIDGDLEKENADDAEEDADVQAPEEERSGDEEQDDGQPVLIKEEIGSNSVTPDVELADNDELLLEYLNKEISGGDAGSSGTKLKARKAPRGNQLEGYERAVYDDVKAQIKAFTDPDTEATLTDAVFYVDLSVVLGHDLERISVSGQTNKAYKVTNEELNAINELDIGQLLNALLVDMPYELFWFDKSVNGAFSVTTTPSEIYYYENTDYKFFMTAPSLKISFKVSKDYSASGNTGTTSFDLSKINAVKATVVNAEAIIDAASMKNDAEKLIEYKDEICSRTSYNRAAAETSPPYGDPWQLIFVFDNDPDTEVVCEGYSKAIQYLCDNTTFDHTSIECWTVSGLMTGGTGAGNHMWNILHMDDGRNYIADVTNSDSGSIGYDTSDQDGSSLFLNGYYEGDVNSGYSYSCGGSALSYEYDSDTKDLYSAEELSISPDDYAATLSEITEMDITLDAPVCGTEIEAMGPSPVVDVVSDTVSTVDAHWAKDGGSFSGTMIGGETYTAEIAIEIPQSKQEEYSYAEGLTVKVNGTEVEPSRISNIDESSVAFSADTKAIHGMTKHAATAATCTRAGNSAYWSCNGCGKYFSDANGETEIEEGKWIISAKGHNWGAWTKTTSATCAKAGVETRTCKNDSTHKETRAIAIDPSAHKYGAWTKLNNTQHQRVCAYNNTHKQTANHTWNSGVVTKAPTCVASGVKTYTCSVCKGTKTVAIPATGHSLTKHAAVAATTAKAGNKLYWSCSKCSKYYSDAKGTNAIAKNSWVIPKLISVSGATVTGVVSKVYTGSALTQKPVVKVGGKTLVAGKGYKLTYKNNKLVGTATMTITGIGAYGAAKNVTFIINPKSTAISSVTAAKKGFTAKWKKQATQTTGYELQCALNSTFTSGKKSVIITKNSIVSKKITSLKAKKKYYVRIRTYKTVSGKKYYSAWSAVKTVTTKK